MLIDVLGESIGCRTLRGLDFKRTKLGFASKVLATCVSALPPDVRRWLCPAATGQITPGYAPGSGLALRIYWAKGHTKGIARK